MRHRILLLGGTGQVGWELRRTLVTLGDIMSVPRPELSDESLSALTARFREYRPTLVVNAAAYTAVDRAETDVQLAKWMNAELPARIATLTKQHGALLVDYSTDCVFDGHQEDAYKENDKTNPLNHYGLTKLEGLNAIQSSGCRYLVFRVSWVYSNRRSNFLKTILRLAQERETLNVIDDQLGSPTPARWIAEMTGQTLQLLERQVGNEGLYNLTPKGHTSWWGFARQIVESAVEFGANLKLEKDAIVPVTTSEYPTPAARPANSRLSKKKIENEFGFELPGWECFVPLIVEQLWES